MQSWKTKQITHEGLPLLLRYPEHLDFRSLQMAFPNLAVVVHNFSTVNSNGLPDPDYNDSLSRFDKKLREAFEFKHKGITVLIETFSGKRNYYIYVSIGVDMDDTISAITQDFPEEKLSWSIHPDSKWGFIDKYSKEYLL